MPEEVFELEFNHVARWTAEAIGHLDAGDAIPAACNGSGNPANLGWLVDTLGIDARTRLLDTGSGLGGPGAWMSEHCGVRPLEAEPMVDAATGAHRLFGHPGVAAWSHQLPFAPDCFDVVLALAVLSTVDDKGAYLQEVRRVLRPGGSLGLLEYVADGDGSPITTSGESDAADTPENNDFLSSSDLDDLLATTGFTVADTVFDDTLGDTPEEWRASEQRVKEAVTAAHAGDRALVEADEQEARFGRLLAEGALRVRLVRAVKAPSLSGG